MNKLKKIFNIIEPFLRKNFYALMSVGLIIVVFMETQDVRSVLIHFFPLPFIALLVCSIFFIRDKSPFKELISFFFFPLFFSVVMQSITYFFTNDSSTSYVLQMLFMIPISNIAYVAIYVKKRRMTFKAIGHLVTTVQSILFVSTIIGFLFKNPLLFDGFFVNTTMSMMGFAGIKSLANLSLSSVIDGFTQTISMPYLFSATAIKGWVEYHNFITDYTRKINSD
ncbi:MAG: hypothetical protein ACRDA4_02305 [Filifactoraceae bacterium]